MSAAPQNVQAATPSPAEAITISGESHAAVLRQAARGTFERILPFTVLVDEPDKLYRETVIGLVYALLENNICARFALRNVYSITELAHAIIASLLSLGVLHADMLSPSRLAALSVLDAGAPAPAETTAAPDPTPAPPSSPEVSVPSHDNAEIGI